MDQREARAYHNGHRGIWIQVVREFGCIEFYPGKGQVGVEPDCGRVQVGDLEGLDGRPQLQGQPERHYQVLHQMKLPMIKHVGSTTNFNTQNHKMLSPFFGNYSCTTSFFQNNLRFCIHDLFRPSKRSGKYDNTYSAMKQFKYIRFLTAYYVLWK